MDKKRYYKLYVDTGFIGEGHERIVEVPEDEDFPSEEELEEYAQDFVFEKTGHGFYECDSKGNPIERQLTTASE